MEAKFSTAPGRMLPGDLSYILNVGLCCGRSNNLRASGHARPAVDQGVAARPLPKPGRLHQPPLARAPLVPCESETELKDIDVQVFAKADAVELCFSAYGAQIVDVGRK